MEALSRMVSATVDRRLLSGFLVFGSRNSTELLLSHVLLTDDTLSFCEVDTNNLYHLHCLFLCLKLYQGLKIIWPN
jgi:hypothetical protein